MATERRERGRGCDEEREKALVLLASSDGEALKAAESGTAQGLAEEEGGAAFI